MLCDNCGKNDANVKYTQIVNGVKKEMHLCEECSKALGIGNFSFDMPMSMSNFFADFLGEAEGEFMPTLGVKKELKCNECGMTYNEFLSTGKFGCGNCYEVFSSKIDPILKNLHNGNRHVGRKGIPNNTRINSIQNDVKPEGSQDLSKIEKLQLDLKKAIKEERYEDAAKIRDEIKKEEN